MISLLPLPTSLNSTVTRVFEINVPPLGQSHVEDERFASHDLAIIIRFEDWLFPLHARRRINNYRGRKDSALALYYLWRTGELMTHHRERFERVYALAEDIAPAHLLRESSDEVADASRDRTVDCLPD